MVHKLPLLSLSIASPCVQQYYTPHHHCPPSLWMRVLSVGLLFCQVSYIVDFFDTCDLKCMSITTIIKVSWDTRGGGNNSVRICLQDPVTGYYKICQSANSCLMVFDINYILWYVEWEWFINVDIQTILFKVWKVV